MMAYCSATGNVPKSNLKYFPVSVCEYFGGYPSSRKNWLGKPLHLFLLFLSGYFWPGCGQSQRFAAPDLGVFQNPTAVQCSAGYWAQLPIFWAMATTFS
jgi:hypothetical protein